MGRKAKYTKQQKVQACEDYLNGGKSASQIAKELNMVIPSLTTRAPTIDIPKNSRTMSSRNIYKV